MRHAGLVTVVIDEKRRVASTVPKNSTIRLLVVDDHPVVCQGLAALIGLDPRLTLVGNARTAHDAVIVARSLRPDVILLDLRLPDMLAPEVVPLLRSGAPGARIVVFTAHAGHPGLRAALDAGVDGILLKDAADVDLIDAVERVVAGERIIDHRAAHDALPGRAKKSLGPPLTTREYEVLRRVAIGETNCEVAGMLGLSPNTVKTYLQTAMQKLGARNRVEAVARAAEAGIL
jgi:DNA-binding NarL/FixJ family response regulator